ITRRTGRTLVSGSGRLQPTGSKETLARKETLMKVGIVGAGRVGVACLTSVVARGFATDVVLVNRDRKKAAGVVTDLQYGAVLGPYTVLRDGDYGDLVGAAVVLITPGGNQKTRG